MDLVKSFKRTVMVSAIALLANGATSAIAADNAADVGHVSASVANALSITETSAVKFGNMILAAGNAAGDGTITLSIAGVRTVTNDDSAKHITLYNGANNGTAGADDAGAQSPGFYSITGANAASNIYVSFSDSSVAGIYAGAGNGNGALIDDNHPNNKVILTGPTGKVFWVNKFVFNESGNDTYGHYITTDGAGAATVTVGGTLMTVAGQNYVDGNYEGTFNIMASY